MKRRRSSSQRPMTRHTNFMVREQENRDKGILEATKGSIPLFDEFVVLASTRGTSVVSQI